ncbi:MAG TPA: ABC transporter permease [Hanamia sp.]
MKKHLVSLMPMAYTLKSEFPEVESVTKIQDAENSFLVNGKNVDVKFIMVDSSFFDVFNLPFISGNANSSLINNNSIVLTESLAKKIFPSENPIGKQLKYKGYAKVYTPYIITGIIKDIPSNILISRPKQLWPIQEPRNLWIGGALAVRA